MCGICGIVGNGAPVLSLERVRLMMRAMTRRGPDGEGAFAAPGVALGMQRLSIIDIAGGQQPIWNESGTLAVIFNGEIYNYRELRTLLENHGRRFRTRSDTETLVYAYEMWGADCVRHLRGMFAFAVVEFHAGERASASRIFLARDRMGIKPLYYSFSGGNFLFASEVRALLASGSLPRQLSSEAISSYLMFGSACEPMTLVQGIYSVPPGCCGYVDPASPWSFEPTPYWNVSDALQPPESPVRGSVSQQVRTFLDDSVRHHLVADVPVGVFLSSGIDSAALAAVASKQHGGVRTFTVSFSEPDFSEAPLARSVAKILGTEHSEFLLTVEEMRRRMDEALAGFDQPSMDGINTYFISWAARQSGLKVALSGLGSDEIFGGYSTFSNTLRLSRVAALARCLPPPVRRAIAKLVAFAGYMSRNPEGIRKLASASFGSSDFPHPYFFTRALFVPLVAGQILRSLQDSWHNSSWWQWLSKAALEASGLDPFTAVSWLETRSYLVNTLLRDTDTMSMCHSLEVRVPFLDDPLLRMALSCPQTAKQKKGVRKPLLIQAVRDLLPEEILRQPKRTFTLPWRFWLRGALREEISSSLSNCDPNLSSIINMSEVMKIWQDFLRGRTSWSRPWAIFVLNEWVRRNLTNACSGVVSDGNLAADTILHAGNFARVTKPA